MIRGVTFLNVFPPNSSRPHYLVYGLGRVPSGYTFFDSGGCEECEDESCAPSVDVWEAHYLFDPRIAPDTE